MKHQVLAIANCRVSSTEQLENNSLNRQEQAVIKAAKELGVVIPDDGWWRGSVSSKRGTNVLRKDLQEMIDRCKKDKRIKYLIVDEPDRFMRSIDEAAYYEVIFRQLNVTVHYASDPDLNKGDLAAKLLKFTKYLSAEGSNEERQRKSISGQTVALKEGRYPFVPKPGYRRGYEKGIPEVDEIRGPILQKIMVKIASYKITPSQGLIELNRSDFIRNKTKYKMDKFRKILTDPFYAGIVEIKKQVDVRNENGLHQSLISKKQHEELLRIMDRKPKNQNGPRKNGNPKYPLNNLVHHTTCSNKRYGRVVGIDLNNGKNKTKIYEKYRCRACRQSIPRQDLHDQIEAFLNTLQTTNESRKDLITALDLVWKENESQEEQQTYGIHYRIKKLQEGILNQIEAATDPDNIAIKSEILNAIEKKRIDIANLQTELKSLQDGKDLDKAQFLEFAYEYIDNLSSRFLDPTFPDEDRKLCNQILFPSGIWINEEKKVYTHEISPLYRLRAKQKDLSNSEKSFMVRVKRL